MEEIPGREDNGQRPGGGREFGAVPGESSGAATWGVCPGECWKRVEFLGGLEVHSPQQLGLDVLGQDGKHLGPLPPRPCSLTQGTTAKVTALPPEPYWGLRLLPNTVLPVVTPS